jgi:16S rRNA C967 or C1407 C5-methylase (RsmB/RsmF family)
LRAENADVVGAFLQKRHDARDTTQRVLRELAIDAPVEVGYRIPAGTADMDGFYYACLEKIKG